MNLSAQIALYPSPQQVVELRRAIARHAEAATRVVELGRAANATNRATLHRAAYHQVKAALGVSAVTADAAVKHVAEIFRRDRTIIPVFRGRSMPIMGKSATTSVYPDDTIGFRVEGGRLRIPFRCGERQREMLRTSTYRATLVEREGRFYLHFVCLVAQALPIAATDYLGVDLGIANLATTSDGQRFSGEQVEAVRARHLDRRRRLSREASRQKRKGRRPKNVRRALRRLGKSESHFRRDVNHCITKQVVRLAEGTKRGIAVEDLNGIRSRTRFAKGQRARMGGWAFAQWQEFCAYKAQRAGVPFVVVNPAYTSQTCYACGHRDKASRLDQARFVCTACGHTAHADHNAAQNIAARAHVEAPMVAESSQRIAA